MVSKRYGGEQNEHKRKGERERKGRTEGRHKGDLSLALSVNQLIVVVLQGQLGYGFLLLAQRVASVLGGVARSDFEFAGLTP